MSFCRRNDQNNEEVAFGFGANKFRITHQPHLSVRRVFIALTMLQKLFYFQNWLSSRKQTTSQKAALPRMQVLCVAGALKTRVPIALFSQSLVALSTDMFPEAHRVC